MDETVINSRAWDGEARNGSAWARIVSEEEIKRAAAGHPGIRGIMLSASSERSNGMKRLMQAV